MGKRKINPERKIKNKRMAKSKLLFTFSLVENSDRSVATVRTMVGFCIKPTRRPFNFVRTLGCSKLLKGLQ
jgi:hypothetical protein